MRNESSEINQVRYTLHSNQVSCNLNLVKAVHFPQTYIDEKHGNLENRTYDNSQIILESHDSIHREQ